MGNMHISLFGKLRIHDDELGTLHLEPRRAAELLCYLLLYRDRLHEREKLATLLWPEAPPTQSKRYRRRLVMRNVTCGKRCGNFNQPSTMLHNQIAACSMWITNGSASIRRSSMG